MYGSHFNPHLYQVIEQTADHFHWDISEEHWAVTKKEGMSDGTDLAGGGHAHTGLMIYQGDNWPAEFRNKLFTANFHGRRINSDSIHREGNSYVAHHGPDYFKTADPWFRGIELIYGPDGGVFLLDWSDIGECHENDGIHRTSGRIFKLTYGDPPPPMYKDLHRLDDRQLVQLLVASNEWYPRKARRILQERASELQLELADPELTVDGQKEINARLMALTESLVSVYENCNDVKQKLRALWAIYSTNPPPEAWWLAQTHDPDEHVRAWGVRLLADGQIPITAGIASRFKQLGKVDPSGLVRLYVASSLPRFNALDALEMADGLAAHAEDADDRVQPKLIWYGVEPFVVENWERAIQLATRSKMPLLSTNIARRLTHEIENNPEAVETMLEMISKQPDDPIRIPMLAGMSQALNGWSRAPAPRNWSAVSAKLVGEKNGEIEELVQSLGIVFGDGRGMADLQKIIGDGSVDLATRRQAILTLANSGQAKDLFKTLKNLISDKGLTTAVTKAMVNCEQLEVANVVLNRFPHMDPEGKTAAINTLVARDIWAGRLLDSVKDRRVPLAAISAAHARQIKNFENEDLTRQLTEVWGQIRETFAERLEQIESLRAQLTSEDSKKFDLENGRMLFEKNCASCHILFGSGGRIGPDLTGSDRKNLNYLLENIVDPSASVAESYRSSVIALEDGRLLTGVVVGENERTLQLQTKDEIVTLDRNLIDRTRQTNLSLMPEGLLDKLTDQEIADLFGYLKK